MTIIGKEHSDSTMLEVMLKKMSLPHCLKAAGHPAIQPRGVLVGATVYGNDVPLRSGGSCGRHCRRALGSSSHTRTRGSPAMTTANSRGWARRS